MDKFEQVLRGLGHVYCESPASELCRASISVRHAARLINDFGEISPFCADPPRALGENERYITCKQMFRDINCAECMRLLGFTGESLTKRSLLVDCIHILVNIEQSFLDAMYWNFHHPDEEPINPDPDGEQALFWEQQADQIVQMLERARPTMTRHANKFGWPDELKEET